MMDYTSKILFFLQKKSYLCEYLFSETENLKI